MRTVGAVKGNSERLECRDAKGNGLLGGDYVRNINKRDEVYTVHSLLPNNFIAIYDGHATMHASQVELCGWG